MHTDTFGKSYLIADNTKSKELNEEWKDLLDFKL